MSLDFVNVPEGANFCNISEKRPLANERLFREGEPLPRTTERTGRESGDECFELPEWKRPKATEISPWYGVYFHLKGNGL